MQQTQEQPLSDSPTETPDPPTNVLTSFGNGTSAPSFSPLTPQQKRHKRSLVRAYAEFWRNVNFSRGYSLPFCCHEDVVDILDHAAEAVVRIRDMITRGDESPPFRIPEGHAVELLWNQQQCDPVALTKNLVCASLKNDMELPEKGITPDKIDKFLDTFIAWKNALKQTPEAKVHKLVGSLHMAANQCTTLANRLEHSSLPASMILGLNSSNAKSLSAQVKVLLKEVDAFVLHCETQKELMVDSSISVKHQIPEVQMADVSSNISDTPKVEEPAPTPVEEKKPEPDKPEKQQTPEAMEEDKSEHIKTEEVPLKQQPAVSEPESQPAVTDSPKPEQPETKEATESPSPMSVEPPPRTDTPSTQNFIVEIKKVADRVDSLKPQIQQLHENSELLNLSELSRNPLEGVKQVEKLQKKSLEYSEYLMRDLLALDKIDSNQAVRPMRKEQVVAIQNLMDQMDSLTKKLRSIRADLEKEAAVVTEKQRAEEEEKRQAEQKEKKKEEEIAQEQENQRISQLKWPDMKLKPKFNVHEQRNAYIIATTIPGLKKEDITLSLGQGEETLIVEGVRYPNEEEVEQMKQIIVSNKAKFGNMDTAAALLRLGAGRFGKFSEKFALPEDADVQSIQAAYEGGVLKVTVPKIPVRSRAPFGFPGYGGFGNAPGFFGDRDVWW